MIPARQMRDRKQARVAIRRIRERAEQLKLGPFSWSVNLTVSLVLDSSAALAWIYSDETTEPIRRVFQAVAEEGAVVQ